MDDILNGPPRAEALTREYFLKKKMSNDRHYDVFHPSEWGVCQRKIAFRFYNEKEQFYSPSSDKIDLRTERIFDNGHAVHARWQKYLDKANYMRGAWKCDNPLCNKVYGDVVNSIGIFNPANTAGYICSCGCTTTTYQEILVRSHPSYNFYGHVDAIVDVRGSTFAKNNERDVFVIDFKSIRDQYFGELTHSKPEHVIQVHVYMWLLNLQCAVVVYENKDNNALREIVVPRDEKIIQTIKQDAAFLIEILRHKKLPDRPSHYVRSEIPCRFCEFQSLCWSASR